MTDFTQFKFAAVLFAFTLGLLPVAHALPKAASVPGGIAIVALGPASTNASAPSAWLGEQAVWVTRENGQWLAVVGLALDLPVGIHELRITQGSVQKIQRFEVQAKKYPEQRITLKDSSKVNLSPEDEARAVEEIARIQRLRRQWNATADTDSRFILPADGRLASRFGLRRFFNGEARSPHSGLDVAVGRGTPIRAASHGKVLAVDDYFFNGKTVFVDHGNGLISMYCHLDRISVNVGQTLDQGQPVGLSGMTGRASGPHLHWSVVLNGVMVDPELFLKLKK